MDLSVVIATYNRADLLRSCLDALGRQEPVSGTFEVVVVVDGSTDGSRALLAEYRSPYVLRVIHQDNAGQCQALNRGVSEAAGRFCLLLDDDVLGGPNLVAGHLDAQQKHDGVLGVGRLAMTTEPDADWYVREFCTGWLRHYARLDQGHRPASVKDCYSGNLSFPRAAFMDVGGFALDIARGYDVELAIRLAQWGLRVVYLPRADAVHHQSKTSAQLLHDEERNGAGAHAIYRRHPAALPETGLDKFHADGPIEVACRSLLLALDVPVRPLYALGSVLARVGRTRRWARFVRHYVLWRGVRQATSEDEWKGLTEGVTILLYHAVAAEGERGSRYVVTARDFAWQIRWLARKGYRVLALEDYIRCRREHRLPGRCVVITFDDGYADNASVAAPILSEYGFPVTIFLVSDRVGRSNDWDTEGPLAARPLMDWDTVRALERAGVRFAPHGRTHAPLKGQSAERLHAEIAGAWADVTRAVSHPVPVFAFPFGLADDDARNAVQDAGLDAACTVRRGQNWPSAPLLGLRRVQVRGDTGRLAFRFAVWHGDERPPFRR